MGGGRRGRTNKNNNSSNKSRNKTDNRRGSRQGASSSAVRFRNSVFVEGGDLADWPHSSSFSGRNPNVKSKSGSRSGNRGQSNAASTSKSRSSTPNANAFGYNYPSVELQNGLPTNLSDRFNNRGTSDLDESQPVVLVDSKENQIVAYLDETPPPKTNNVDFIYDYNPSFILGDSMHRGLGFCEESEATKDGIGYSLKHMEEGEREGSYFNSSSSEKEIDDYKTPDDQVGREMAVEILSEALQPKENAGFISIGGMKLFTEDISDEESDEDLLDDQTTEIGDQDELSESDGSEDTSDSDLDIEEEIAEDYLEGIGGGDSILDATWLAGHNLDDLDDDSSSSSCFDETVEKLGGIALQEASRVYGMEKSYSKKKCPGAGRGGWSSTLDDLMLVKDPRTISGRKKHAVQLAHSWPSNAQKSKGSRSFPGEKKKHCKESIAIKRRERMLRRGVDLEKVNMTLEQIVLDEVDMFSFQPMHSRDCSQVQRLAAVYRLRSWSQGSGKKRFVTVIRTQHTCMPSASDKLRLEKLIGAADEDADFAVNEGSRTKLASTDRNRTKNSANRQSSGASRRHGGKKGSFANQPVTFVASGVMQSEGLETTQVDSKETNEIGSDAAITTSAKVGAFEVHTRGFGSKMMAKMGYVEGGGLGKDGQGVAEPIEVVQRPKSLGLGIDFATTSNESVNSKPQGIGTSLRRAKPQAKSFGAFEKHTKGFGSKMMARMGFVEGMGLGRDSQGIVNPLVAVRLPKSRGLGSKGWLFLNLNPPRLKDENISVLFL